MHDAGEQSEATDASDHEADIADLRASLDEGLKGRRPDEDERDRRAVERHVAMKDRADAARERPRDADR